MASWLSAKPQAHGSISPMLQRGAFVVSEQALCQCPVLWPAKALSKAVSFIIVVFWKKFQMDQDGAWQEP